MSNIEMMRGLYDAFGRGDIPTVLGALDPGIRWHEAEGNPYVPSGEAFVGPDSVLNNVFMKLGADFDGFACIPRTFHDAGKVVVVEAPTAASTGRPADPRRAGVPRLDINNGKVANFQQYVDTAHFQDVMGARA